MNENAFTGLCATFDAAVAGLRRVRLKGMASFTMKSAPRVRPPLRVAALTILMLAGFSVLSAFSQPVLAQGQLPQQHSAYGANDTIGAANRLTPAVTIEALKLAKTGKVYSLAMDFGDPRVNGKPFANRRYAMTVDKIQNPDVTFFDDSVSMGLGSFGTSIDGLGHIARGDIGYNGIPTSDFYDKSGLKKLAINGIPPMVTRGILLDVAGYLKVERLPPSLPINSALIKEICKHEKVQIRAGDVVLIHTGWQAYLIEDPSRFVEQPGLDQDGARFLIERGIVAVGADNHGDELFKKEDWVGKMAPLPVHPMLITDNGIYILEDVKTDEIAKDHVYEFLFVLAVPKFVGAVQSPIHPIAIR